MTLQDALIGQGMGADLIKAGPASLCAAKAAGALVTKAGDEGA
jgi:hypothetical protein